MVAAGAAALGLIAVLAMIYLLAPSRIQAPEHLDALLDTALRQPPFYCDFVNRQASRMPPGKRSWIPTWLQSYAAKKLFKVDSDRLAAFSKLQSLGTNAWPAIPALLAALDSSNPSVRGGAVHALIVIHADKAPAFDRLKTVLAGKTRPAQILLDALAGHNNFQLGTFLMKRGPHVVEVVTGYYRPPLYLPWYSPSPAARFILSALAACGRGAKSAMPLLRRMAASHEEDVLLRAMAISALGEIDLSAHNQTVPLLRRLLRDSGEWPRVRGAAAASLARLAPNDADVPVLLRHVLHDQAGAVRVGAAEGLWRLKAPAGELLPVLTAALNHKLVSVRCASLRVLAEMGGAARPAKPAVEAKLKDRSEVVRRQAALTLKRIAAQ